MPRKIPTKKSTEAKTVMPTRRIEDIITEWETLKAKKKVIEDREKVLKNDLGIILEGEGIKDSKGSFNLVVGDKMAQKQARKSVKLNETKAEELFRSLGIWEEVIETKEVINESLVEQAILNEKITVEDLESITDVKITYATLVKDYKPEEVSEEMPFITQN